MAEARNEITPGQTLDIATAINALARDLSLPHSLRGWHVETHPGGLPGLLTVTFPGGVKKKLRLVLEEMPSFDTSLSSDGLRIF